MLFLKRLFGLGSGSSDGPAPAGPLKEIEHKGFTIGATPYQSDGQYQTCGLISKEIGGEVKEHRFVRADRMSSRDDLIVLAIAKGRQIIDEQGEAIFR